MPDDPAFARPTKPIGPFLDEETARRLARDRGWTVGEDAGRGYRRLVAVARAAPASSSSTPSAAWSTAASVVIAAGGGGMPVVRRGTSLRGVDAVIDKDYAAERLASSLHADALVLVTGVDRGDARLRHARRSGRVPR